MKVVHIIGGLGVGGAEASLFRLISFDSKNTHCVISLTTEGHFGKLLISNGITVIALRMDRRLNSVFSIFRLYRNLRTFSPDVVQTWMYHADLMGGFVARIAGVRRICWGVRHGSLAPDAVKPVTALVARLCAWSSSWIPHAIISCSEEAARAHIGFGYASEKFQVIPNGFDLEAYFPSEVLKEVLRRKLNLPVDLPLIGMVARQDPQKDHDSLIEAMKLLCERRIRFHCVFVGLGMDSGNLELMRKLVSHDVDGVVSLFGRRSDVPDIMNALDLHVLSSLGEAFPNVLAEAMACGTPCVSTDVGDAEWIIGDTGWLVPPGNPKELANAVESALLELEVKNLWNQRASRCRARIRAKFDVNVMVERFDKEWERQ